MKINRFVFSITTILTLSLCGCSLLNGSISSSTDVESTSSESQNEVTTEAATEPTTFFHDENLSYYFTNDEIWEFGVEDGMNVLSGIDCDYKILLESVVDVNESCVKITSEKDAHQTAQLYNDIYIQTGLSEYFTTETKEINGRSVSVISSTLPIYGVTYCFNIYTVSDGNGDIFNINMYCPPEKLELYATSCEKILNSLNFHGEPATTKNTTIDTEYFTLTAPPELAVLEFDGNKVGLGGKEVMIEKNLVNSLNDMFFSLYVRADKSASLDELVNSMTSMNNSGFTAISDGEAEFMHQTCRHIRLCYTIENVNCIVNEYYFTRGDIAYGVNFTSVDTDEAANTELVNKVLDTIIYKGGSDSDSDVQSV